MKSCITIALAALSFAVAACAIDPAAGEDDPDIGKDVSELRGGRVRWDHEEIGKLWMKFDGKWLYCTATLVDRKIAITAGHCVKYRNQDKPGNYGFLDINKKEASGFLATYRYTVTGYHNFDGFPHLPGFDPDDIGLVRLAKAVPCSVAHPAGLRNDSPKAGTVVSRWGYGRCSDKEQSLKRVRHFTRGGPTFMICHGDSGGPTMDPDGKVYQVNSGFFRGINKDTVARVEKEWNGITRVMNGWGRAGRCP
jgi:hypothetical protein